MTAEYLSPTLYSPEREDQPDIKVDRPDHLDEEEWLMARTRLDDLLTTDWHSAREYREELRFLALNLAGYETMDNALEDIGPRTSIVFIAAGAGTRWDTSFQDQDQIYEPGSYDISRGRSRAMARVPNVLPREVYPEDTIPVIGYNLWASRHIPGAKRCVISREEDAEEIQHLAAQLGISVECRQQQEKRDKVRGHGDAVAQNLDIITDSEYTLTQFCGDTSSPKTIHDTLLALEAMKKTGIKASVLMATTPELTASSQLAIDPSGLVRRFNQLKLFGKDIIKDDPNLRLSGCNASIYAFDSSHLIDVIEQIASVHNEVGTYTFLPHHSEDGDEFAIDDIILAVAEQGKVRQLCVASPEETTTTKDLLALPNMINMMREVVRQNDLEPGR
jgi:hypothetical protein